MLALIAFIVVVIGAGNWFCIGLLQYDFVAGLFGSQASIFSRIVYVAVGVSAIIIIVNLIKNKGKIIFNFTKFKEKFFKKKNQEESKSNTIENKNIENNESNSELNNNVDSTNKKSTQQTHIDNLNRLNESSNLAHNGAMESGHDYSSRYNDKYENNKDKNNLEY